MGDSTVRCPDCGARLKVPEGKTSVRCPKCGEKFRIPDASEDEDVGEPAGKSRRRRSTADDADGARPPRSKRRPEDNFDDQDEDQPRRRGRGDSDDEDEDEDERPRKRGGRARKQKGDGPWLIAALAAPICFLLTLGGAFLLYGTAGLAAGNDGPGGKLVGLGIGFLVSLILMTFGTLGVKNRHVYSKWGTEIRGGTAVALGMIQAVLGGLIGGFCLYGLVFTLINGR